MYHTNSHINASDLTERVCFLAKTNDKYVCTRRRKKEGEQHRMTVLNNKIMKYWPRGFCSFTFWYLRYRVRCYGSTRNDFVRYECVHDLHLEQS